MKEQGERFTVRERAESPLGETGEAPAAGADFRLRKAVIRDADRIQKLVNHFASKGLMLGLSLSDTYEHIRDFTVAEKGEKIVGACALHVVWKDLAEIRSLAVDPCCREIGIGRALVEVCIEEARFLSLHRIFALTYQQEFFGRMGFQVVDKGELPHKVWSACLKCTKFPDCDETAVLRVLEDQA